MKVEEMGDVVFEERCMYMYTDRRNSSSNSEGMDCKTIALCLNGRHMLAAAACSVRISLVPAARSTPDGTGNKVDIAVRRSERIYTYGSCESLLSKWPQMSSHAHTQER